MAIWFYPSTYDFNSKHNWEYPLDSTLYKQEKTKHKTQKQKLYNIKCTKNEDTKTCTHFCTWDLPL